MLRWTHLEDFVFVCFDVHIEQDVLRVTNTFGVSSSPVFKWVSNHSLELLGEILVCGALGCRLSLQSLERT
jgi:hypothetical protein